MKFTRQTLRALALGFLISAVVTAAFAVFFQGNVPIQGVNVSSVLNGGTTTATTDQQSQVAALESEKAALESTQNSLNASIASLKDAAAKQSSELASLKKGTNENSSAQSGSQSSTADGQNAASSADESQTATTDTTATDNAQTATDTAAATTDQAATTAPAAGTESFTVAQGATSDEIAQELAAAGFISSPQEFIDVVDRWDLSTILQAGTFQLSKGMNVNTIAEILTQGVYYWIP